LLAPFAPLAGVVLASLAGCSLTVDLAGYAGGGDDASADASDGDIDTTVEDTSVDTGEDTTSDSGVDTSLDTSGDVGVDTSVTPPPDASDAADASDVADVREASVDADASDATDAKPDSADSSLGDAADAADTADATDATDATDTADGNPCGPVRNVGLSEIMIRTISGTGDTHEWFELTNYDAACTFDVGGMRVTTQSWSTTSMAFISKANVTLPAGTKLAPGASLVFADLKATFLTDASSYITTYALDTSLIIDLNWTFGDLFVNGADNIVDVYYPGATLPSESVTIKARGATWPTVGRSFEFPGVCDPALRLLAGTPVTTSTHWTDTTSVAAEQYGTIAANSIYGTPGRKNDLPTACP
jgi:hypothetical protein